MSFVCSKKKKKPGAENSFQTIVWFKWSEAEECAGQRQRAPTFPQGLRAWEVGWQNSMVPVTADAWLSQGASVAHVAVLVPYDPQEVEAERQQGRAQQVTQSRQVRDGKTVGIFAAPPHGVHHPVWYTQQQQHLEEQERRVRLPRLNMTIALGSLGTLTSLRKNGHTTGVNTEQEPIYPSKTIDYPSLNS